MVKSGNLIPGAKVTVKVKFHRADIQFIILIIMILIFRLRNAYFLAGETLGLP